MVGMTEPMSDALFGVDGTEMPRLSSERSGRDGWRDMALPPPLPPIPGLGMTPEAIAAALGEDPPAPTGQEPAAAAAPSASLVDPAPPPAAPPSRPSRPVDPTLTIVPVQPQPQGSGGPRYRTPLIRSRPRVQLRGPRRRVALPGRGLSMQLRSNGGAGTFFVAVLIVFVTLLYFIIAGIVESIARLIP